MTEQEFLRKCRELIGIAAKGLKLCADTQAELNDDYSNGRISHEEWRMKSEENSKNAAFFKEQLDLFGERFERVKKY